MTIFGAPVIRTRGTLFSKVAYATPIPKHHRYRMCKDGYIIGYLTAPIEGKYVSLVWQPKGKGARSGHPAYWGLSERLMVQHSTRKAAKARAVRLWMQHEGK